MSRFNKYILVIICPIFPALALAQETAIYLGLAQQTKVGMMPACTPLQKTESRGKANLRDLNKSWPKFRVSLNDFDQIPKFSDLSTCVASVELLRDRYEEIHLTSLSMGNLMPGMPSEFALMMLGPPSQPPSITSYLDPVTGQPKTYSFFVWNNQKKRNFLGSALTIAGAATGVSAAAGAVAVTQAASLATTAAAAAYSIESLKSARVITIQVDEKKTIQTFSSQ